MMKWIFGIFLVLTSSCSRQSCCHYSLPMRESDYFLVLLVDTRHLDYSNATSLLASLSRHADVGHAWICLCGLLNGKRIVIEGGHSGELGIYSPRYMEAVMDNIERGDPNPIKSLWETQRDGFFQHGSGGHRPTFAAKIELTPQQFTGILSYMDPTHYEYSHYAMTGNQCASFVAQIAQIAGMDMVSEVVIPIEQTVLFYGKTYVLWTDPRYSSLNISTPDSIECCLKHAVKTGTAEDAMSWYANHIRTHSDSHTPCLFNPSSAFCLR